MVRPMTDAEVAGLLTADVPAFLATLDGSGFPHVTALWFVWTGSEIVMTSLVSKPHVARLRLDRRVGLCIQQEWPERPDGQRPNFQVRITGEAALEPDDNGRWTRQITQRYVTGPAAEAQADVRAPQPRVAIRVAATERLAVASL